MANLDDLVEGLDLETDEIEDLDFEKALAKLEGIVENLEEGSLSLDQSLAQFVKGVKLIKFCNNKLEDAEKKIEIVLKEDDDFGDIVPFTDEGEES